MKPVPVAEPFAGANIVGLLITIGLLVAVVAVAAGLPPMVSGFLVAFLLGLTTNPKASVAFIVAGAIASAVGFAGQDPQIGMGGIGVVLSSIIVKLFVKS